MRSIAVFLGVFSTLPIALVFPFAGVLLWAWIAFMSPHREAFGFAFDFPFNFYIAAVTLVAYFASNEPKRLPSQPLPGLFILFAIVFSISTYFALDYAYSFIRWDEHIRTSVLILTVIALTTSKLRIQAFLWIVAISIGYYAVKGGGYFLLTGGGGGGTINGPVATAIEGNNELSVAICMAIPIFNYLRQTSANPFVKVACIVVIMLSVVAVIGTFSRSGFIGLAAVGIGFIVFSRPKFGAIMIPAALALAVWNYAPQAWFQRINTLQSIESDSSANQRFAVWETSWRLALDRPLTGGGFSATETDKVSFRYSKTDWRATAETQEKSQNRAAHSIYFQVLGDHGFLGLMVWLMIIGSALFNLAKVLSLARDHERLGWARMLSRALIVSFSSYLVAGAFLSMAYYDAFMCLLALTVAIREIVTQVVRTSPAQADDFVGDMVPGLRTARTNN